MGRLEYSPVCANLTVTTELNVTSSEQVTFFSPCHLGCEFDLDEENPFKSLKKRQVGETDSPIVKNCKCIDMEFTNVEFGSCAKYACDWRIYLIIPGLVFGCFLTFFQAVPGTLVTQAIVPDHLRSAALGLNALFYRIFGTIPVPILAAKEWFLLFFVLTKYFIFESTKKKNETGDRFKMSLVEY